jgi:hypothetical protein
VTFDMFAGMHTGAYQLKKGQVSSCDFQDSLIWCMCENNVFQTMKCFRYLLHFDVMFLKMGEQRSKCKILHR